MQPKPPGHGFPWLRVPVHGSLQGWGKGSSGLSDKVPSSTYIYNVLLFLNVLSSQTNIIILSMFGRITTIKKNTLSTDYFF